MDNDEESPCEPRGVSTFLWGTEIGESITIWHLAPHAPVRGMSNISRGAYLGPGVPQVGDTRKIQNRVLVYDAPIVKNGVFVGPTAVFANDLYPRSARPSDSLKGGDGWQLVGVTVRTGASIAARRTYVAPVTVGAQPPGAAASVVVKAVPAFATVVGVPACEAPCR